MRISASDIDGFLSCRRKWYYGGDNGLHLEPKEPKPPLFLGTGVHYALETFYRNGVPLPLGQLFSAWANEQLARFAQEQLHYNEPAINKTIQLGIGMLEGYLARYGTDPCADSEGMRVIVTEQEFAVPIPGTKDGWLVGRMDGLCRDRQERLWVLENKTYSQAPSNHILNTQTLAYSWAANRLAEGEAEQFRALGITKGTRIYGALYNGLRKQLPGPNVTKPLFLREWVMRSVSEFISFEWMLRTIHDEMARPDVATYPTYSRDCEWCDFISPCLAAHVGEDVEWILATSYRRREPRGIVYNVDPSE